MGLCGRSGGKKVVEEGVANLRRGVRSLYLWKAFGGRPGRGFFCTPNGGGGGISEAGGPEGCFCLPDHRKVLVPDSFLGADIMVRGLTSGCLLGIGEGLSKRGQERGPPGFGVGRRPGHLNYRHEGSPELREVQGESFFQSYWAWRTR